MPPAGRREQLAADLGEAGLIVEPVTTAREAVEDCDVVCTATKSAEPVLRGTWLSPGTHLNAIGAHYPDQREVDTRTVERSRVIVDTIDRAQKEEGELIIPHEEGAFDWSRATELGSVVAGATPGRTRDDEITYFTSGGLGIEYLSVGRVVYDRAVEAGVGRQLPVKKGW